MLKLYYIRKHNDKELVYFGEYESKQELQEDLTSMTSPCLWGEYIIVNDATIEKVTTVLNDISETTIVKDWRISERISTNGL